MKKSSPPRAAQAGFMALLCASAMLTVGLNTPQLKAQEDVNWRYYGNDQANTRFQNIDQITTSNASQLKVAWVFHTGVSDSTTAFEATPIVVDGKMYVSTGHDDVFALNAATGKQLWAYHPTDMPPLASLPICCNNDNRGVAVGLGFVFEARLDATLVALNIRTGQQV